MQKMGLFLSNAMISTILTSSLEKPNALSIETTLCKFGKNLTKPSKQVQIFLTTKWKKKKKKNNNKEICND